MNLAIDPVRNFDDASNGRHPVPGDDERVRILVQLYNRCISLALCALLSRTEPDYEVIEAAEAGPGFAPTLILTDLPVLEREKMTRWPGARIIIFDEGLNPLQAREAFDHPNVCGIIRHDSDDILLRKAIGCVRRDEVWIDGCTVKSLIRQQRTRHTGSKTIHLINQEKIIIELLLQGLRNKAIADQICLSESTVKVYLSRIYKKFQVRNRFQLISQLSRTAGTD